MAQKSKNGTAFFERGSWHHRIRYYDEDLLVRYGKKGGFKTEEEAEKSYYQYLNVFEEQRRRLYQKKNVNLGLKEYLSTWLQDQQHFEVATQNVYQYVLRQALPYIPNIKLHVLCEDHIDVAIRTVSRKSSSYGLKLYEIFNMALSDALSECLIEYNPILGVVRPKREKIELYLLDDEQKKRFLKCASYSEWYLEILLGMFCGLKKGEIYGLKFGDFNEKEETVTIQRQVIAEYPKDANRKTYYRMVEKELYDTNAKRTLKVPKAVITELQFRKARIQREHFLYGDVYQDHNLICCQKNGKYKSATAMNNALKRLCEKAELPNVSVQDLRDMYAEMMLKFKRVSFLTLTGLLGYSSIEATFERYSHLANKDFSYNTYINQVFQDERI